MVRTDAKNIEGTEAAIERAKAYVQAGAEAIFPEALKTENEYETFRKEINVPLLANMTEFGKTPLYNKKQLENFGYNIAIYPVSSFRIAMGAIESAYAALKNDGSLDSALNRMQTRERLYELLKYEDYNQFDQNIHDFKL